MGGGEDRENGGKVRFMLNEMSLSVGEMIYGLGERFGPVVKNGQSVGIWNQGEGGGFFFSFRDIFTFSKGMID